MIFYLWVMQLLYEPISMRLLMGDAIIYELFPLLLHLHALLPNHGPFYHVECVTSAKIEHKSLVPLSHGVLGVRVCS
jgi:hypothetical protein